MLNPKWLVHFFKIFPQILCQSKRQNIKYVHAKNKNNTNPNQFSCKSCTFEPLSQNLFVIVNTIRSHLPQNKLMSWPWENFIFKQKLTWIYQYFEQKISIFLKLFSRIISRTIKTNKKLYSSKNWLDFYCFSQRQSSTSYTEQQTSNWNRHRTVKLNVNTNRCLAHTQHNGMRAERNDYCVYTMPLTVWAWIFWHCNVAQHVIATTGTRKFWMKKINFCQFWMRKINRKPFIFAEMWKWSW